jgi:hypothetical protein
MRTRSPLALAVSLLLASPMATLAATDEVHVFALAAVTIGPDGEVAAMDVLQPPLPEPVRDALQQTVRGFRFEPVRIAGAPASVTTGMMLSTCIAGIGDELAVAAQPTGIVGPQPLQSQSIRMPIPRALFQAVRGRTAMAVDFTVEADGSARMNSMTLPRLSGRERRAVEKIYADWIGDMRFVPEQINGQPVATRMVWPISWQSGRPANPTADATCARARAEAPEAPHRADDSETLRLRDSG